MRGDGHFNHDDDKQSKPFGSNLLIKIFKLF